jgi:glutathione S-transferase
VITVHHLNNSRSQRVLWLLEELGEPYEIVKYQRDPQTMLAPPELKKIHPLGKSPVVVDGDIVLAESGAILEYFVEKHGRLVPKPGTPDWRRYRYWMHYAEGSAMPPMLLKLVFDRLERAKAPFFVKPIVKSISNKAKTGFIGGQIKLHLDFMEGELAKSAWFAGDEFSVADIQMSFPLEAATARAGLDGSRPRLMDFLARIHARPAYKRALERGGVFKLS